MAELQTGPRYLCLRHHCSRRTCFGPNVCRLPAECQISLGFTNDPHRQPGSGGEVFSGSWRWCWEGENQWELLVGGGVIGSREVSSRAQGGAGLVQSWLKEVLGCRCRHLVWA